MPQSNYIYNKMLEYLVGNRVFTNTDNFYIALSTTDVTSGETLTEPSGNGYSRLTVPNNSTNWSANTNSVVTNNLDLSFAESTTSWGTIKSVVILDALTGGNQLYTTKLTPEFLVQDSTVVIFPASSLKFGKVTQA